MAEKKTQGDNYKNSEFYRNGRVWPISSGDRFKMEEEWNRNKRNNSVFKQDKPRAASAKLPPTSAKLPPIKKSVTDENESKKTSKTDLIQTKEDENKKHHLNSATDSEKVPNHESASSREDNSDNSTDSEFEYFLYKQEKRLIERAKRQSLKEWKEKQIKDKIENLENDMKVLKRRVRTAEGRRTEHRSQDFDLGQKLSTSDKVVKDEVTHFKYNSDTDVAMTPRQQTSMTPRQQETGITTKYNNYVKYESSSDSEHAKVKPTKHTARKKWRKKILTKGKPQIKLELQNSSHEGGGEGGDKMEEPSPAPWKPVYYPLGSKMNLMAEGGQAIEEKKEITFACLICGHDGMTETGMRSHIMMEHVEQDICCPFCDLSGITPNEMNLHVNKVHLQEYFNSDEPKENGFINSNYKKSDGSHSSKSLVKDSKSESNSSGCDKENRNGASWIDPEKRTRLSLDVKSLEPVLQLRQNCADNIVKSGVAAACGSAQSGLNLRSGEVSASAPPFIVPDINDNVEPDINCNIPSEFCCPLCHFSTSSEGDIQSHVNREHVDILSPCKPPSGSSCGPTGMDSLESSDKQFLSVENSRNLNSADNVCPICGIIVNTTQELEIHVNSKHSDILSPDKPYATSMSMSQSMESAEWSDILACPVCDQECDDPGLLQLHVNGHFSAEQTPVQEFSDQVIAEELEKSEIEEKAREQKEFRALQAMYGMVGGTNYKKQYEKNLERAVIRGDINLKQFHEKKANLHYRDMIGIDDGHSCCKGLIPKLKEFYKVPIQGLSKYWICSYIDHFAVSYGDRGWGCGYRNFQMLLSGLTPHPTFCKVVFNDKPQIPSIPKIQRLIEAAWAKGFDKQGCEQLGGKLVDTTKWIGATEIVAVLSSLKVRCQLLDFHNPSGPQGTHPRLFQWIKDYFQQPSPIKLPLYLQHHGHSRTVIGIEELKDGSHRLLIFDPSTGKKQMSQFHGVINANLMRTIRRTIHGLKAKQYQIVAITGILEDREYEEHKILKSERIS